MRTNIQSIMDKFILSIIDKKYNQIANDQLSDNERIDALKTITVFNAVKNTPINIDRLWNKN